MLHGGALFLVGGILERNDEAGLECTRANFLLRISAVVDVGADLAESMETVNVLEPLGRGGPVRSGGRLGIGSGGSHG